MEMLSQLNHYDQQLFVRVFSPRRSHLAITLTKIISRSGEGGLHVLVLLLAWQSQSPLFGSLCLLLLTAFATERAVHWVLKNAFQRPRPQPTNSASESLATASSKFSFPSGHSSRAFLLATVLLVIYGPAASLAYLWAAAVALSRVVLGVHYPGDIIAGAAVGSTTALLTASALGLA
ncbi:Phosphatidylglycerophosphatase B [Halioglobus japonicus]|nr:Phosphatidylglycerophosphatase B [Halioglobus japonicus]